LPGPGTPGDGTQSAPGRQRRRISRSVKIAFLVAAMGAGVWYVLANWQESAPALARIGWFAAIASIIPAAGGMTAAMLTWRRLLADLGSPLPVGPAGRIFFASQLGKYLPGSVWTIMAQVELGRELKVPRSVSFAASILSMVLSLTVGLCVALVLVPFAAGQAVASYWWIWFVVPILVVALHPRVITWGTNLVLRTLRRSPLAVEPTLRGTLEAAAWQVLSWLLLGLHCYILVRAVGGHGWAILPLSIGGFAFAYGAGLLFIPAPAGAGVRELALGAALVTVLPSKSAIAVVVVSRLALAVNDLGMAVAWPGRHPRRQRRTTPAQKHEE
jgi:uncharacterized membrane protein YbhN (UPF0104 family)